MMLIELRAEGNTVYAVLPLVLSERERRLNLAQAMRDAIAHAKIDERRKAQDNEPAS